jgi:hypothetical protein
MEPREALTIRFPAALLTTAKAIKGEGESLNELVVGAVEREIRRRHALQAYEEVLRLREAIKASSGPQADSGPLIRSLREGVGRRD